MDLLKRNFEIAKKIKLVQLILICGCSIFLLLLWCLDKGLRQRFFAEHAELLFLICIWILVLVFLTSNMIDFLFYKKYAITMHEFERIMYLDSLTGIPDRKCLDQLVSHYVHSGKIPAMGCCILSLNNLDMINNAYGRNAGNEALKSFSTLLETAGDGFGLVARNGGSMFVCLIEDCDKSLMDRFLATAAKELSAYNTSSEEYDLKASYAYTLNSEQHLETFSELFSASFRKLSTEGDDRGLL